uniref:Protease Do-like 5, chloroplastic n=1 Tax=Noccaea caerulescens TaxID=107243 RepID=A0A1J3D862_NOCCA
MAIAFASSKAFSSISHTLAPFSRSSFMLACSGSNHVDLRRRIVIFGSSLAIASTLLGSNRQRYPVDSVMALEQLKEKEDELEEEEEEDRNVNLFQKTSPSVVFIKDIELPKTSSDEFTLTDEENAKVEGTGSGFVWDKLGHIVTNYHVISKLATDQSGLQRCKVSLVDAMGTRFSKVGEIVGLGPDNDLAVLKIETDGRELKPVVLGTSTDLRVGQSCYAIGNPYGYENTLTIGVVSGLGREIQFW